MINFNLADVVIDPDMGGVIFTVLRQTETVSEKGRATFAAQEISIRGNIQPAPGKERELLPEEDRGKATIQVFTPFALRAGAAPDEKADVIRYVGSHFRVCLAEPWREHAAFTKALAVLEPGYE